MTQTTHQTSHGQLLDLITAPIGTVRATLTTVITFFSSFCCVWCCVCFSEAGCCERFVNHHPTNLNPEQVDLKRYTIETHMRIVTFKTAYYSFYLPVACGLLIGGVADDASLDLAKDICVRMGQYFQASTSAISCLCVLCIKENC